MVLLSMAPDKKIKSIAAGHSHSAAITESGELYMWGMKVFLEPQSFQVSRRDRTRQLSGLWRNLCAGSSLVTLRSQAGGVFRGGVTRLESPVLVGKGLRLCVRVSSLGGEGQGRAVAVCARPRVARSSKGLGRGCRDGDGSRGLWRVPWKQGRFGVSSRCVCQKMGGLGGTWTLRHLFVRVDMGSVGGVEGLRGVTAG